MPILARETDIYPNTLFDLPESLDDVEGQVWWTLYTLSRREKQLMRTLHRLKTPFYSPMVAKRTSSSKGRVRTSYVPLFPGYVFMYGTAGQRHEAMTSNCISRCIEVPDGDELRDDLQQIHKLIDIGAPLTVESRIQSGDPVRIRSGAFAGLEGIVQKRHSHTRLVVTVRFIQRGASVLLDDCQVDPI